MKKVAGKLRLELAQFRELAAFAQFSSDLDEETKKRIERGKILTEILKQRQYEPMPVEKQVAVIFAAINGLLDDVEAEKIKDFEEQYLKFMADKYSDILNKIIEKKDLDEEIEGELKKSVEEFKEIFGE